MITKHTPRTFVATYYSSDLVFRRPCEWKITIINDIPMLSVMAKTQSSEFDWYPEETIQIHEVPEEYINKHFKEPE